MAPRRPAPHRRRTCHLSRTTWAVQDNGIDRIDADIRDLRHGRGLVIEQD